MKTFFTYFIGVTAVLGFITYATIKKAPVFDQEISNLSAKVTESRNTLALLQSKRTSLNTSEVQTTELNQETDTEVSFSSPENIPKIATEEEIIPNTTSVFKYENDDSEEEDSQETSHYRDEDSDDDEEDENDD